MHSHTVHLPRGALLTPCAMCGTGAELVYELAPIGGRPTRLRVRFDRASGALAAAEVTKHGPAHSALPTPCTFRSVQR